MAQMMARLTDRKGFVKYMEVPYPPLPVIYLPIMPKIIDWLNPERSQPMEKLTFIRRDFDIASGLIEYQEQPC